MPIDIFGRASSSAKDAVVVLTTGVEAGNGNFAITVPTVNGTKQLVDASVKLGSQTAAGEFFDSMNDGTSGFNIGVNTTTGVINVYNRIAAFAAPNRPWRVLATYL